MGENRATPLKALLDERHTPYKTFVEDWIRTAKQVEERYVIKPPSEETWRRWRNGGITSRPIPDNCRVLSRMFPSYTVDELLGLTDLASSSPTPPCESDDDVNRREMIQRGTVAIAAVLFNRLWSEPGQLHQALDSATVGDARLGYLQHEAARLGVQAVRVPPAELLEPTLGLFCETRELVGQKQTLAAQRELTRCAAMFATVMGECLFNLGQFHLARTWYEAGRRAAIDAGDHTLADYCLCGLVYLPTYSGDPRTVIELTEPRVETAKGATPALAWLWAFRAKAEAKLGDARAFERSIDRARRVFGKSSATGIHPGIFSFEPPKLEFYESRARVDLAAGGNAPAQQGAKAAAAAERAIARYDFTETTEPALARFEQASAYLVGSSEVDQACTIASATITDARTWPSITVVTRAHEFDSLVGDRKGEAVTHWREVLATLRPPDATLALSAGSPLGFE